MTATVAALDGVTPFEDFRSAAQGAVEFLHDRIGLDLWLVTEVKHDRQYAVVAHPSRPVQPGMSIPWAEGFCRRMVAGEAPRVASVTAAVPAYAGLTFGPAVRVAAYVGVPLLRSDGSLFGTLCGFALRAQPPSLARHLPLVEHIARLLGTVLAQEGAATERERRVQPSIAESERDALTGLLNRRGWERAVQVEESRSRRTGASTTVIALEVDGLQSVNDPQGHAAGDAYLRCVAEVLRDNSRPTDVLARIGGHQFAVLLDTSARPSEESEAYIERLQGQLAAAGCSASLLRLGNSRR